MSKDFCLRRWTDASARQKSNTMIAHRWITWSSTVYEWPYSGVKTKHGTWRQNGASEWWMSCNYSPKWNVLFCGWAFENTMASGPHQKPFKEDWQRTYRNFDSFLNVHLKPSPFPFTRNNSGTLLLRSEISCGGEPPISDEWTVHISVGEETSSFDTNTAWFWISKMEIIGYVRTAMKFPNEIQFKEVKWATGNVHLSWNRDHPKRLARRKQLVELGCQISKPEWF